MGNRIRELRIAAGLSQNALANQIGISSVTTIRNWENGDTGAHTWELAAVMANISDWDFDRILTQLSENNPARRNLELAKNLCKALQCEPKNLIG